MSYLKILISPLLIFFSIRKEFRLFYLRSKGVKIGNNTFLSPMAYIDAHKGSTVTIGNNCYITRNVVILNHTDTYRGGPMGIWIPKGGNRILRDVVIGNNVFIGVNSVIMPGVTIGDNSVVGALSLVNKSIPPNTVWAGNPAKQITTITEMMLKEFPNFSGL